MSSAQAISKMQWATSKKGSMSGVFCCNFQVRMSVAEMPVRFNSVFFVALVVAPSEASADMSDAKHLRAQ